MATQIGGYEPFTLPAAADLSAKQYYCVKQNSSGQFALCSAATDLVDGILQNLPKSGEQARVQWRGILKVKLGGTVTVNALASVNSSGLAVVGASTNPTFGKFMDAGVSGDIVRVWFTGNAAPAAP